MVDIEEGDVGNTKKGEGAWAVGMAPGGRKRGIFRRS
jgi:hypothetical protein